jgi:phage-related protein
VTRPWSKTRIKWEGDSQKIIRDWPKDVKENFGGELERLEHYEDPLDSKPMGKVLPGVSELLDKHNNVWYRVMYWLQLGWIYVLHCFTKKTNKTSAPDIKIARKRVQAIKARNDKPAGKETKHA